MDPNWHWRTQLQHLGEDVKYAGAVTPPIFQTSTFAFDSMDELMTAMVSHPDGPKHHYSRLSNPSLQLAEEKIAMLEGTEACKLTGTGMGALTMAVLSSVQAGSHVVLIDTAYGPLRSLVTDYLAKFGVTHTLVMGNELAEIEAAIQPDTSLIYLESPSSMLFQLQDLEGVAKIAKAKGISTVCDNTYNTPLHLQPHKLGIDLVCHSATKYMGGHSDLTAGAVCGTRKRIERMLKSEVDLLGSVLHPFQSWLLTRSLRTLELRLKRHEKTGNEVASWLERQPEVELVNHISLESFPQRELYLKMMQGSGGLFSFVPKCQDHKKVKAFVDALKIFQRGVSWGGYESLALTFQVQPMCYSKSTSIVRLFCGLEEADDLIADLSQGFEKLKD